MKVTRALLKLNVVTFSLVMILAISEARGGPQIAHIAHKNRSTHNRPGASTPGESEATVQHQHYYSAKNSTSQKSVTDSITPTMVQASDSDDKPGINADYRNKVVPGEAFAIVVWLDKSGDDSDALSKTVYMEQSDTIQYNPSSFKVKPGERKVVKATVKSPSGLASIDIWCDGYEEFTDYINSGFTAKMESHSDESTFQRGETYAVTLNFVNAQHEPVSLDAPVDIQLRTSNADLSLDMGKWSSEVNVPVGIGSSSTELFYIRPSSMTGRPITLSTQIALHATTSTSQSAIVLADQNLTFVVQPAWWFLLFLAALGGLLPAIYRVLTNLANGKSKPDWAHVFFQVLLGGLSGMAAYALAGLDILGIRLDTSPPRTFFILGFLFAYIGLDVLLNRFVGSKLRLAQDDQQTEVAAQPTT